MNEVSKSYPQFFSVVPAPVRYSSVLNAFDKILFTEITARSNQNGCCSFSNSDIAKLYSCKAGKIKASLANLKKNGFIKIFKKNNNYEIYQVKNYN